MMGAMLLGMLDVGYAQQQRYERPDFKLCFDILRKNRAIYNKYNDSIFLIKDHAEWVNFFRHRALKNHRIYLANQGIINSIDNYFNKIRHAEILRHAMRCLMLFIDIIMPWTLATHL